MSEKPILFKGPMVQAILEGRKTQTRRICKDQPHEGAGMVWWPDGKGTDTGTAGGAPGVYLSRCPYGQPGDRLWVKESHWRFTGCTERGNRPWTGFVESPDGNPYKAICYDDSEVLAAANIHAACYRVPSIHMPRWASRILLEITDVRVEKLNSIGQGDACAEGCPPFHEPIDWYQGLWEDINGKGSWNANPWVWVIQFQRVKETQG
jgi:hypothetical protein